jgi:poly(hydroxyalkanoate) depolymerase family esterase
MKLLACMAVLVFVVLALLRQMPPLAHASSGTFQQYTYSGSAGSRPYFVYTPANYQVGTAVPLIVMLHGCTQTPSDFATGTQMNQLADADQFIVVYPQQTSTYNSSECWNWFQTADQARGSGEPAIIAGIVQTVEQTTSQWTIDPNRIYVAGLSAGAAMSVVMGATYPDIFAAIGVASGLEYQAGTDQTSGSQALTQGGPSPTQQGQAAYNAMGSYARVVPTIVFHGTSDYIVYPINGDQVVQQWMQTDHLASSGTYNASFGSPTSTINGQVPNGHAYTEQIWNNNAGREVQEYWKVSGMGHAWSGGNSSGSYTDPQGPNASQAMYTFFMNHPLTSGNPTPTPTPATSPTATPTATLTATPTNTPTPAPTSTPTPANNGVTAKGSVAAGASAYFMEEDVYVSNTAPITAFAITIVVQKTTGIAYNSMYSSIAVPFTMSHSDNGSTIVFTYTLNAGQSLAAGTNWTFAAQITGTGTPHATANDTYTVTTTSNNVTDTLNGHF